MKPKLLIISLVAILVSILNPAIAFAWDEGVGLANDFGGEWWNDAQGFANTIDAYANWNKYFISNNPLPSWWQEESSGGTDNSKADYTELSLMSGHSVDVGGGVIGVSFGTAGSTGPSPVRLGYASPDNYGYNIWWFVIACEVFKDSSYVSWCYSLTGTHMLLGFKSSAVTKDTDMRELANRLTGSGGFSKENVQWAFFHTYVDWDGTHNYNQARILAENAQVADNDYIDSFVIQTPVDSTKLIINNSY